MELMADTATPANLFFFKYLCLWKCGYMHSCQLWPEGNLRCLSPCPLSPDRVSCLPGVCQPLGILCLMSSPPKHSSVPQSMSPPAEVSSVPWASNLRRWFLYLVFPALVTGGRASAFLLGASAVPGLTLQPPETPFLPFCLCHLPLDPTLALSLAPSIYPIPRFHPSPGWSSTGR